MFSSMFKWVLMITTIVLIVFSMACFFLGKEPGRDMKSKFESGIDQGEQEHPPFYMHFFYVGILFLIFDVEIIISIPMINSSIQDKLWTPFWSVFFSIVFLGLIIETTIDSIEWKE